MHTQNVHIDIMWKSKYLDVGPGFIIVWGQNIIINFSSLNGITYVQYVQYSSTNYVYGATSDVFGLMFHGLGNIEVSVLILKSLYSMLCLCVFLHDPKSPSFAVRIYCFWPYSYHDGSIAAILGILVQISLLYLT